MRKLLAFALILMIVSIVAGCSRFQKQAEEQPEVLEEGQADVSEGISAADEDSADLSSETAENLDEDLEDFAW